MHRKTYLLEVRYNLFHQVSMQAFFLRKFAVNTKKGANETPQEPGSVCRMGNRIPFYASSLETTANRIPSY